MNREEFLLKNVKIYFYFHLCVHEYESMACVCNPHMCVQSSHVCAILTESRIGFGPLGVVSKSSS